jgi:hypothetical protein
LKANDVEIPMFRLTIRSSLTSTNVSVSFDMKLDRQDQHLIDTDKLNGVTDYKWIILYFISLNFYCLLKNKFDWIWEYSKTKIGHNFLPGLVRRNLNADLNVSVLRKKISKWTYDTLLILISGRCSWCWRDDVRTCPQRRRRRHEPTTLIQCPRAWCDVPNAASWLSTTWSHGLEEIEIRLHGQPS